MQPCVEPLADRKHPTDLNSALCLYITPHMPRIPTHIASFPALGCIASYRQECVEPTLLRRSPRVKACSQSPSELPLSEDRARVMGPLIYGQLFVLCVRGGLETDWHRETRVSPLYRGNYSNHNE